MMTALGAIPVLVPFAETVNAIRTGVVDCAITGTLSGNEVGLSNVTSYIYPMAISWGLSFFGANAAAWEALPPDLQALLREAITGLEAQIWDASDRETADGVACDVGAADCSSGHTPSHMTLVPITPERRGQAQALVGRIGAAKLDTSLRPRMCGRMEPGIGACAGDQGRRGLSRRDCRAQSQAAASRKVSSNRR